uniref:ADAMTS-like 7 n=1 Tax=Oryzias latipes TaxID=8090 RepID=A0A3P9H790_ORYLA
MAGLWEQLCSLQQGRFGALIHLLCLFSLVSGALPWDIKRSSYPLQVQHLLPFKMSKRLYSYLAEKTKHGISIINGNWVIDRPGTYFALGTQLIYKRPNEIRSWNGESITAPGPLTDDLHLYLIYQQPGPSVHYEYSIPIIIHSSPEPDTPDIIKKQNPKNIFPPDDTEAQLDGDERINTEAIVNSITVKEKSHSKKDSFDASINFVSQSTYVWTKTGHSGCSTTCGTGKSPHGWDIGEWSECSRKCGPGSQMRQVICRQVTRVHDNRTETSVAVAPEQCGMSGRPMTQSTCQLKICSHWEIRSDWSPCSVPCGVGQRSREVVCVSNQGVVDDEQECNMSLKPDFLQNCDMGVCARSWFTSLWSQRCSAECGDGIQTRSALCIFTNNGLQEVVDQACSCTTKTKAPCKSGV